MIYLVANKPFLPPLEHLLFISLPPAGTHIKTHADYCIEVAQVFKLSSPPDVMLFACDK